MKPFLLLLLLTLSGLCYAQSEFAPNDNGGKSTWSVAASWSHGRIIKHNSRFKPIVTESSSVWELYVGRHLAGKKSWHERLNYPIVGMAFVYADLGDTAIFGKGFGMMATAMFQTRFKKWHINYRLGTGLGYLSRFYHPVTNSTQNAIGSHVNNVTQVMLGVAYHIKPQLQASLLFNFTHFSNGRTQTPNLGINIPALGIGLYYQPQMPKYRTDTLGKVQNNLSKRIHFGIKIGQGVQEWDEFGGPKYPISVNQLYIAKRVSPQWQLHLGVESSYYWSNHYIGIIHGIYTPETAYKAALKISPYLGAELFLGKVSLYASVGGYVYNKAFVRGNVPTKLGLQYYISPTDRRVGRQWYVGVYLKSHFAVADYTELGMGYLF